MPEQEFTHLAQISAVCTRPGELGDMAKNVRRFARALQKEFDNDIRFELSVVVNPHGTDTAKEDAKPQRIGFDIEIKRDDADGNA